MFICVLKTLHIYYIIYWWWWFATDFAWRGNDKFMFISIEEALDLSYSNLNVLHIAVMSVLQPWSRLGDTWFLQRQHGNVGLGFSSAVDDYLSQ